MPRGILCRRCGRVRSSSPCTDCAEVIKREKEQRVALIKQNSYYTTPAWRRLRTMAARIFRERFGIEGCIVCGSLLRINWHHVVPRSEGGPDSVSNLCPLCGRHHTELENDIRAGRDSELRRKVEATPQLFL